MNKAVFLTIFLLAIPIVSSASTVHWTASVKSINVKENESVWIGLEAPTSPNPSSAVWNCSSNIVWLGTKDSPASSNMLSIALALYATERSVRVGVRGSGNACEAEYMTARD